ncbi:MAG: L-seryl-tRNA(Sec) selenium transferase [Thermodesulfobacteriota bacterium]
MKHDKNSLLRILPSVDRVIALLAESSATAPRQAVKIASRKAVDALREEALSGLSSVQDREGMESAAVKKAERILAGMLSESPRPVVNGTGVVVHTNLGRSLLSEEALRNVVAVSRSYSNLEFDLAEGRRGSRYSHVDEILCELTGAEASLVVNNNAAAVFLCLETLAKGREVVVSRGELVEIGGSFRIPDVMARSGAVLREVGTTNRTHPRDYEEAIGPETALLLKAHTSNFAVVGFTASVPLAELTAIGARRGVPVMEDLGSGCLLDLSAYGLPAEPTVQDSVAAGADLVTFSGDKALGGPQAGIIVGKADMVARLRKNPINRALRIDKMTLAALSATLRLYRDPERALSAIPTLAMLTAAPEALRRRARRLSAAIKRATVPGAAAKTVALRSRVGGGALPLAELPSFGVVLSVEGLSVNALERVLRTGDPPVIGRIENDALVLDARTLSDRDIPAVAAALSAAAAKR